MDSTFRKPDYQTNKIVPAVIICLLTICFSGLFARAAGPPDIKKVLLLFPDQGWVAPAYRKIYSSVKSVFNAHSDNQIVLLADSLDLSFYPPETDHRKIAGFLQHKYAGEHIQVVIPVAPSGLNFMLRYREILFPDIPIVACAMNISQLPQLDRISEVTGVAISLEIPGTIELVRQIYPGRKKIGVVAGTAPLDRYFVSLTRQVFESYGGELEWIDLTGLPMPVLLERVSRLPADAVILYLTLQRDGNGSSFASAEAQLMVSKSANVPLFNFIDAALGYGSLGGRMTTVESYGRAAAEIVLRILSGENAGVIAPVVMRDNPPMFDLREMKRWGIAESTLPPGSIVRFQEFSVWEEHRWRIFGGLSFLCLQALLILGLFANLHRRKRVEAALSLSEANLRNAQDVARMGSFRYDIVNDGVAWSEGTSAILGVPSGLDLNYRAFLQIVHPDDREYVEMNWKAALGGEVFDIEFRILVADRVKWLRARVEFELDRNGQPLFGTGFVQDISQHRQAEYEAGRLRRDLAHVARVSTVGELSQNLAHELNQPLAAILLNTEAALQMLEEAEPDLAEICDALGDIVLDQQRAREIVQRIRKLVKKEQPEYRLVDLNRVVRDTLKVVQVDAMTRGARLLSDLEANLPLVWGDPVQLQQVVLNLLLNALEAVSQAGVARQQVTIASVKQNSSHVVLTVSDTGPGIDKALAKRLFEPFFTTKSHGLGLGLSISRSIVEAHGGEMAVEASQKAGATFRIILPVAEAACADGEEAACPRIIS
jgi:PAS domain S-box-containing protein